MDSFHTYMDEDYVKCGEIFKSLSVDYKQQYMLKCIKCPDLYDHLEDFITHCGSHWNNEKKTPTSELEALYDKAMTSLEKDVNEIEYLSKQYEEVEAAELESFTVEKYEPDIEIESVPIKEESFPMYETEEEAQDVLNEPLNDDEELFDNSNDNFENDERDREESDNSNDERDREESDNAESEQEDNDSEDDSKYGTFANDFVKTKSNVIELIEAYQNQPSLWNSDLSQYRMKECRQKCLETIAKDLSKKLAFKIYFQQVASVLNYLCCKYRKELETQDTEYEDKTNVKTASLGLLEHMNFLKPFAGNKSLTTFEYKTDLTTDQTKQILSIYEKFPHLWNTNYIEYFCKNKRQEALDEMLYVIATEMDLKLSQSSLEENIQIIHSHFSKIKRHRSKNDNIITKYHKSKYYNSMKYLYDHVGPFPCPECGKVFYSTLNFRIHKSQHDGSNAFTCSVCNKEYNADKPYVAHIRRHMDDLNEECKECGKRFLFHTDLKIHMRCHTGAKPFCCEICGQSFRHGNSLSNHRRRHEKRYLHHCSICNKGFYAKDKMNEHIKAHKQIRDIVCQICGKTFTAKKYLQTHEKTHEDVRNYACKLCGKTFKLKVGVYQHMKTHGTQI